MRRRMSDHLAVITPRFNSLINFFLNSRHFAPHFSGDLWLTIFNHRLREILNRRQLNIGVGWMGFVTFTRSIF